MQLSIADQIWNRAAMESGGSNAREGDRALSDLLLAHGMVMNGGIGHALEVLSSDELAAAVRGYRFFGLDVVASLLEHSVNATEQEVNQADARYGALIPSDQALVDHFEVLYGESPHAFASID
ncbi:MAG TPA: hypothetical protein VJU84_21580 [Pyrinomonadaceae bacterium]|nr:hypothetical protein [Pyrinomonadaceae bacterium]